MLYLFVRNIFNYMFKISAHSRTLLVYGSKKIDRALKELAYKFSIPGSASQLTFFFGYKDSLCLTMSFLLRDTETWN